MLFRLRREERLAVNRAAGGREDEALHAALSRLLQQTHAADHIYVRVEDRIGNRAAHVHLRGVMADHVRTKIGQIHAANVRFMKLGAGGFIGYHVSKRLLERGERVAGVDNLNPYYDPRLKEARLARLRPNHNFTIAHVDIADTDSMQELFGEYRPRRVVHLAAQAG